MNRVTFIFNLAFRTFGGLFKRAENNHDRRRFGDNIQKKKKTSEVIITLLQVIKKGEIYKACKVFSNPESRKMYIDLLLFRILGPYHFKLPTNNEAFWKEYDSVDKYLTNDLNRKVGGYSLQEYSVDTGNGAIRVQSHPIVFFNTFIFDQYIYSVNGTEVNVAEGDVVIEGGACWGESTLNFMNKSKNRGKVYSFEFEKKNLEIFRENMSRNPELSAGVTVVERALWDKSDVEINYAEGGPGTSLLNPKKEVDTIAKTLSIDDFADEYNIEEVDFIKMDIEGAEEKAIRGAIETIKKFKPKLAIAIYHSVNQFYSVPLLLEELNRKYNLGYSFYLNHYTIHTEETILFAVSNG